MAVIEVRELTKKFDKRIAVDRLNLTIEEGELFGLLGPNGAGKTTLVRMLTTVLQPAQGAATVCGYDIQRQPKEVRRVIGIAPQDVALYDDLTAAENLAHFGKLYGVKGKRLRTRITKLLKLVQLEDRAGDLVKTFSSGMKRRLNLMIGLIHEPRVLFLDEPTTGFDPAARLAVWDCIKRLKAEKVTILLSTHYMEEADYLCDRVAIMDRGKIVALGTPAELKRSVGKLEVIEVRAGKVSTALVKRLRKLRGVKKVVSTSEGLRVFTPAADAVLGRVAMTTAGARVDALRVVQPTLEDVFIKLTGRTLGD